ncbi:hypothetical protein D7I46_12810 [Lactococcus allomyrinae]|uniref:Uncharacterized protein n=2 Tax=Lactococcus allomyrinae TaxID=2419773 RepID=A0A387BU83_9LACT|nr:hypothetical protein D7I46_12810 [Lactococcus allomyrinae]
MPAIVKMPVLPLFSVFILTIIVAYVIAWLYRNDYDPMKMIKAYLIYALPFLMISMLLHVKIMLIIGIYILGLIILVFRNQHYFDH